MNLNNILIAFGLTLFAGLATGIGSAIAFFAKRTNMKFLAISLGFSAGVMVYVSFVEILNSAFKYLITDFGKIKGSWITVIVFFCGIFVAALLDKIVPSSQDPHDIHNVEKSGRSLFKVGVVTALAIGVHNFPEGLVTFAGAMQNIKLGFILAFAVAIHNIPEGIAVSTPIYYATNSKKQAFLWSFLSGIAEPIGALFGYLVFYSLFGNLFFGILFAFVAGIMIFISFDQLMPAAREYGDHHLSIYGLVAGMGVMAVSLLLFL